MLIRIGLDDRHLPPVTFAGLRYALASGVLWAWIGSSPVRRVAVSSIERRHVPGLVLLGLLFYAVAQGAQFVAIDHQSAAATSLVLSLTPAVVAALAAHRLGERAGPGQWVGAGAIAIGATLVLGGDLEATAVGMAAAVAGLAGNAGGLVCGRWVNRDGALSPVTVTATTMTIGAVVMVVVGALSEPAPTLDPLAWLIVAWLAVVNTALAFTLWNLVLARIEAGRASALQSTMLVQITLLAWVFLGEFPGVVGLVGVAVASVGVRLASRQSATSTKSISSSTAPTRGGKRSA